MDIDKIMLEAVQQGIRDGIKQRLSGSYGNPLDGFLKDCIDKHANSFRSLLSEALGSALTDDKFREEICAGVRHKLGSLLVARFGGELEKQVNALKSDPTTRARITLAIDEIVRGAQTV